MTSLSRPPFPSVLDSTIIAGFRSCPRSAELAYFQHWKPENQSVHLVAGAAYASGLEVARESFFCLGEDERTAEAKGMEALIKSYGDFQCPPDSPKSLERMLGALEFYFSSYPMATDKAIPITLPGGKRGIEFSFSEPIDIAHPETGDPILYVGRMDMICEYDGMILGEDDKTASQLGASWPKQWDLRSQFTGYTWGAQQSAAVKLDGFLVRGVSILKTKYDTMQAITQRPQWQLDRWYEQLLRDVKRMIQCWEEGYFDLNLDHACAEYGGCQFRQACLMRDPTPLLEQQFQRRIWDPVNRKETLV